MLQIRQINHEITLGILDLDLYSLETGVAIKRELERAGTHYVLGKLLNGADFTLDYTLHRKPFLTGGTHHISISHSHDKLAVILNKNSNTGVDIELVREKVKQIEHKFLREDESMLANGITERLIWFWAAKETLYKVYGLKEVDFRDNLFIDSFSETEIVARLEIGEIKKKYRLACETQGGYKLVYVLNEI